MVWSPAAGAAQSRVQKRPRECLALPVERRWPPRSAVDLNPHLRDRRVPRRAHDRVPAFVADDLLPARRGWSASMIAISAPNWGVSAPFWRQNRDLDAVTVRAGRVG
jgi:hypothetical protein